MSLSEQDRKLWLSYVMGVQPMACARVKPDQNVFVKVQPKPQTRQNPILDLHGMTLSQAHAATQNHVTLMRHRFSYVTVITGKSGILRDQLPHWVQVWSDVRSCELDKSGGAYKIWFKRTRQNKQ